MRKFCFFFFLDSFQIVDKIMEIRGIVMSEGEEEKYRGIGNIRCLKVQLYIDTALLTKTLSCYELSKQIFNEYRIMS